MLVGETNGPARKVGKLDFLQPSIQTLEDKLCKIH